MRSFKTRYTALIASGALTVLGGASAYADDTEIFLGNPGNATAPNIMLVLDTSGSMGSSVTTVVPYDPYQTYIGSGTCNGITDRVYYSTNGSVPDCGSSRWFPRTQLKCRAALQNNALGSGGSGIYINRFIRWGGTTSRKSWRPSLSPNNPSDVECQADNGTDGDLTTTNPYPTSDSSSSTNGVWLGDSNLSYWRSGTGIAATLYSANYITYWNQHRATTLGTRMSIMKDAAVNLLNSLSGVNIGLMRYSRNGGSGDLGASGGMVAHPVSPIEANRQQLIDAVNAYTANGFTPLSETLFEAYRYFSGGEVLYGNSSVPFTSVASSREPATVDGRNYNSPADYSCQKNYIIYLTDGLPTADSEANPLIQALPDFATLGGQCDVLGTSLDWPDAGLCLVPLSRYMRNADLRPDVPGFQNVISHWIGFGEDVASGTPFEYLRRAAGEGEEPGGRAYAANDAADLTSVLTTLTLQMLQTSTTFTAPTVAVNAFNRTRSLSDLYVSVFQPAPDRHWPGNLKKYRVKATTNGAVVVGQDPNLGVIDTTTGFFVENAQSFWSDSADGPNVRLGGAANKLPTALERNVYTYLGTNPGGPVSLSGSISHQVSAANTLLTDAVLGIGTAGDPPRDSLINWVRGQDVLDEYPWSPALPNGDTIERRRAVGDPVHAQPALVIYGGTPSTPNIDDAVAFLPTNDGFLHAVRADNGIELWSFIPQELLPGQKDIYLNNVTSVAKNYLLDGEIRVLKFDVNGDGIVEPSAGDRVLIYFGQGRGGSKYYALDVTNKDAPRFMWSIGAAELPGIGQAWSTPTVARVDISGATQNTQKLVLVIGGGYDSIEDNSNFVSADAVGNKLYMVDALTGSLLWSAGQTGESFNHARMTHSIPATVSVLDTNSDGYADRMYVGDMAAQLWRFDIANGNAAGSLVRGGVIASLGAKEGATATNVRRFYNSPDVAAVQRPSAAPFLNIAIGSGYRGHPLSTATHDRFYSIRDFLPFSAMSQAQYDGLTILSDADLPDITTDMAPNIPPSGAGWKLSLNQPGGTWRGEKSLGQATTINNSIVFTTYTPHTGAPSADPCAPTLGTNRAYAVRILDGAPARVEGTADPQDRYDEFAFGGIATDISTMILEPDTQPCTGPNCPQPCVGDDCPPPNQTQFVCLAGVRVLDVCREFDSRVKTYWRESGAN